MRSDPCISCFISHHTAYLLTLLVFYFTISLCCPQIDHHYSRGKESSGKSSTGNLIIQPGKNTFHFRSQHISQDWAYCSTQLQRDHVPRKRENQKFLETAPVTTMGSNLCYYTNEGRGNECQGVKSNILDLLQRNKYNLRERSKYPRREQRDNKKTSLAGLTFE